VKCRCVIRGLVRRIFFRGAMWLGPPEFSKLIVAANDEQCRRCQDACHEGVLFARFAGEFCWRVGMGIGLAAQILWARAQDANDVFEPGATDDQQIDVAGRAFLSDRNRPVDESDAPRRPSGPAWAPSRWPGRGNLPPAPPAAIQSQHLSEVQMVTVCAPSRMVGPAIDCFAGQLPRISSSLSAASRPNRRVTVRSRSRSMGPGAAW
jgi:hypothetical protein